MTKISRTSRGLSTKRTGISGGFLTNNCSRMSKYLLTMVDRISKIYVSISMGLEILIRSNRSFKTSAHQIFEISEDIKKAQETRR